MLSDKFLLSLRWPKPTAGSLAFLDTTPKQYPRHQRKLVKRLLRTMKRRYAGYRLGHLGAAMIKRRLVEEGFMRRVLLPV